MSAYWKGESTDDPSYNDTREGTTGGMIINLGLGGTFPGGFELRLQTPVFVIFGVLKNSFVPTIALVGGVRF